MVLMYSVLCVLIIMDVVKKFCRLFRKDRTASFVP